jgi:hypothetical protein
MGLLDGLLNQVKNAVTQHTSDSNSFDPSKLLAHIGDLFNNHPANGAGGTRPASQDPYGDPGSAGSPQRNVKSASEDPYGDPADQKR